MRATGFYSGKALRYLFFHFLLAIHVSFPAQIFNFQKINQENGLPSTVITSLMQDSRGLLWVGTDGAGLVRYNGSEFKIYDESNGLYGGFITDVVEDARTNLIIATKFHGLWAFDGNSFFKAFNDTNYNLRSNHFHKLVRVGKAVYALGENDIVSIGEDYSLDCILKHDNVYGEVNSVAVDEGGSLWIASDKGLFVLTNKELNRAFPRVLNGHVSVARHPKGNIIVSSPQGSLYKLSRKANEKENSHLEKIVDLPGLFKPKCLFVSRRGTIWLGGDAKQGVLLYDNGHFKNFKETNGFDGERVHCFVQDNARNLFIGTIGTGLYKTGPQMFINYRNTKFLDRPGIYSILKDSVNMYVGIREYGIYRYKEDKNGELQLDATISNSLGANVIIKDNRNEVMAGTQEGLYKIINNTLKGIQLSFLDSDKKGVTCIRQDRRGRFFIGTYGAGLCITDSSFKLITSFNSVKRDFPDYIYTIDQINDNKWYVGTNTGLYILTEKTRNAFELSDRLINHVTSVSCKDSYGNFWFVGNGCIYTIIGNNIRKYDKKSGLISTLIYTLLADLKGNIWSGSNLGIDKIRVNPEGELVSVKNYNSNNGFTGLETNTRAQCMDKEGNLYFGTAKGLIKCINNYELPPLSPSSVSITNIKLANQHHDWLTANSLNKWINLPDSGHKFKSTENQLTFQYGVNNVGLSDDLYYSYKLDNIDKSWSYPSQMKEVSYTNLPAGDYVFRVRMVYRSGEPATRESHYSFNIEAPFYLRWWFIISTSLLLIVLIYMWLHKFSLYDKDYVKDRSGYYSNSEIRLYLLFLGVVAPLTEIFIEIFKLRQNSELLANIIVGFGLLVVCYLSGKSRFILRQLHFIAVFVVMGFFLNTIYKISFWKTEFISVTEYFIVLFFSFILFKNIKHQWIYMAMVFAFVVSLFFNPNVSKEMAVVIANGSLFIVLMNYAAHINNMNTMERLMFANNIVHNSNSLAIATNKMGELAFCSKNITRILGYTQEEVLGLGFWNLTEDHEFEYSDYSKKYIKDKVYIRKLKCKNGDYKYIQWIDTRYTEDLYIGIGQDVTERIKIEEQYRNIVQDATDLIFETDHLGHFTFVNNAIFSILGYTPPEIIGKHVTMFTRKDYLFRILRFYFLSQPKENHFDILEFPVIAKNGDERWISQKVSIRRNDTGGIIGYSAILRDITKLKSIEFQNAEKQRRRNRYNAVLNELTTDPNSAILPFGNALHNTLEKAAYVLKVDRMSVWKNMTSCIECSAEVAPASSEFYLGKTRQKSDLPKYFNAITAGITIIVSDTANNEYADELFSGNPDNTHSLLEMPILRDAEFLGVISCQMEGTRRDWDEEDVSFVRSIADIISISIETRKRQKIENQLAFRNEISLAVAKITEKLLVSENVQTTLKRHLGIIGEAARVSRVYYYENDIQSRMLTLTAEWLKEGLPVPVSNQNDRQFHSGSLGILSAYLRSNQLFAATIGEVDDAQVKKWMTDRNSLSTLVLPVVVKGVFYGIIGFDNSVKERTWAESHLVIIKALASNIANAIERIRNEQKIKESENNFRQINETIQDVFWLYDIVNKRYIYVSPNSWQILGVPDQDFYNGRYKSRRLILDSDRQKLDTARKLLPETGFYEVEYRVRGKANNYKWINEKSFGIRNEYGELVRSSGVCRDVTDKKKIEAELKQLSIVAEKTNNAVLITEADGRFVWANQGFLDLFEVHYDAMAGRYPKELFMEEGGLLQEEIDALNEKNYVLEMKVRTYLKKVKWVEINSTKIFDDLGKVVQQIEVITDITERVEYRNNLQQRSNDLEFQGILQQKIINAHTYEELTLGTLGFIQSHVSGCVRISLVNVNQKADLLTGHALINNKLERVSFKASETNSFSTVLRGETYIMKNLLNFPSKSPSDVEEVALGVRSYLVLPIMNGNELMGTLNISFDRPLHLEYNEIRNLESFAVLLSVALRQIELKQELSVRNRNITDSLIYAKYIQNAVLPEIKDMTDVFKDMCLYYRPKDIVSGDFYWAKQFNGLTFLALADCTGHGVPGAFLTLIGSRILEEIIITDKVADPAEVLTQLDRLLFLSLNQRQSEIVRDGMEIGLCVIDQSNNKMLFSGSGRGLLYYKNGEEFFIQGHRRTIGDYNRFNESFATTEIEINGTELFYLFTDGYHDQLGGPNYRRFSRQKLLQLLKATADTPCEKIEALLQEEIEKYTGTHKQTDDMTVIAFRIEAEVKQHTLPIEV